MLPDQQASLSALNHDTDFLAGGGEMGERMRGHDWAGTSLGAPAGWPQPLKTVVRLLLTSNHPMFIWWGDDLLQLYNDAYRETLGPERHPAALGAPGRECWREAWHIIGPDIEQVMAGGPSAWYEDRLVPLTRNGKRQDVWWTYGYSPIEDGGRVRGVLVICNDVTHEHVSREGLRQSYDNLIETMDEGFCVMQIVRDAQGRPVDYIFVETNSAFARQTGLADAKGRNVRAMLPDIEQHWIDIYGEVARTGEARRFTEGSDAMGRWFSVYASRVPHMHDGVALLFTDISAKRQAEAALVASEAQSRALAAEAQAQRRQLDALLAAAPVGIVYADAQGGIGIVNPMNRKLWGEHPMPAGQHEYAAWKGWWADGSPRHGQPVAADEWPLARVLRGEKVGSDMIEIEPFGQPDTRRILLMRAGAILDDAGAIVGAVAANMDVTSQLYAERELRISEEKLHAVADTLPQMVWTATPDGRNEYVNLRCREYTGVPADALVDDNWVSVVEPADLSALRQAWQHSVDSGQPFEHEHRLRHRSGEYRWVLNRALPVRGPDGTVVKWMGSITDFHEQRSSAEAMVAANTRKDEFLAMLAHELRNPLAPISSAAQILKMPGMGIERIGPAADVIARQVRHMTELIDDLLDVSRVQRGLVELDLAAVDMKAVVQGAIEQARPLIERAGHVLTTRIGSAEALVHGDRKRLIQVVANLLTNAAKYTEPGGEITLTLHAGAAEVALEVADTGIGIAPSLLPDIFDLFTQAARTPDRSQGGLGLGLALVRSMVGLHGGSVAAHSGGIGTGSTFTIRLPRHDAAPLPSGEPQPVTPLLAASGRRVLIVDDNVDGAEAMQGLLGAAGHDAHVAHNADTALHSDQAFDVYLLDIGLPGMNGHALARILRNRPASAHARLIAVSGYGQQHDIAASLAAGCDAHITKPADIHALLALIADTGVAGP